MARLSGLQRDVLALYRECLRLARQKPAESRSHFLDYTRHEFRKAMNVDRKDFAAIEYLIRRGRRQLEHYSSPAVRNVTT